MVYTGMNDLMNTNFVCGQVNREIQLTNAYDIESFESS